MKGGLYRVFGSDSRAGAHAANTKEPISINELHRQLGHVSHDRARLLVIKGLVKGIELEADGKVVICESCEWAKGQRKSVTKVREGDRQTAVGDEIHSNLWGPAPVESISRKKYYVTFTDDYSWYTNIYFLHSKDKTFDFYQAYEAWLFTQYKVKIKCLRSDQGGEYLDDDFSKHLRNAGTTRKLTVHDTPGVAERLNRTLLEKVRAMLHDSQLLKFLWAEAAQHAVYLKNRTWTHTIGNTTPYELLNNNKPNLGNLQPWGCRVRVHNDCEGISKLEGQSHVGWWLGFDGDTRDRHRIYWPERRTVSVERNVKFNFQDDEVVVGVLLLEGEFEGGERSTPDEAPNETEAVNDQNETTDDLPTTEGRGKHIRKETEYVRALRDGTGVTGDRSRILPRGIQMGSTVVKEQAGIAIDVPEIDYAMATATQGGSPKAI